MIPILYGKEETDFTTNGQGRLTDAKSCIVTEERHGIYELELQYPINGIHYKDIELDSIIKAVPFDNGTPQLFTVYDFSRPINGIVTISACHISYRLRLIPLMPFTGNGIQDTFAKVKANALGECPFDFWTNIESERRYVLPYPDSIRGKLQGDQWSILQAYSGEYEFDNYTVKLWESRGSDKGQILRYGKNITNLKQDESIQNTITGIVPYWYGFVGEEQEVYYLPEKVLYSENVDNFPYKRTACIDFTEDFAEKPTEEELRARGQKYISDNNIGVPSVSISISFVDLSKTEEYEGKVPLTHINLCDTITVKFTELGVSTKAKVTRTKWNVLLGRYEEIYIGSTIHSLAQTIVDQGQAVEQVKGTTIPAATENAIKNAVQQSYYQAENLVVDQTALITGNSGGYVVLHDSNGDEEPDEILVMDTDKINTAQKVWRWNNAGLGYSSTGYQGPYITAWTIDGKFNADFIQTGVLSADLIKSGTINADLIKTGTLNANLINVINLIAEALSCQSSDGVYKFDIGAGHASLQKKNNGAWVQRIGIGKSEKSGFQNDAAIELGTYSEDQSTGYVMLSALACDINVTVFMIRKGITCYGDIGAYGGLNGKKAKWVTLTINGTSHYALMGDESADSITIPSQTTTLLHSGTFNSGSKVLTNAKNYRLLIFIGNSTSNTSAAKQTLVVPTALIGSSNVGYEIAENEGTYAAINLIAAGNNIAMAWRGGTGSFSYVYGIS